MKLPGAVIVQLAFQYSGCYWLPSFRASARGRGVHEGLFDRSALRGVGSWGTVCFACIVRLQEI